MLQQKATLQSVQYFRRTTEVKLDLSPRYWNHVVSPARSSTFWRVPTFSRNRSDWRRSKTGRTASRTPCSLARNKRPSVPETSNSSVRAYRRASRSSMRSNGLCVSNPRASTSFSPSPRLVTKGSSVGSRTGRTTSHESSSTAGRGTFRRRPSRNSAATASGMYTCPTSAGNSSKTLAWCRY